MNPERWGCGAKAEARPRGGNSYGAPPHCGAWRMGVGLGHGATRRVSVAGRGGTVRYRERCIHRSTCRALPREWARRLSKASATTTTLEFSNPACCCNRRGRSVATVAFGRGCAAQTPHTLSVRGREGLAPHLAHTLAWRAHRCVAPPSRGAALLARPAWSEARPAWRASKWRLGARVRRRALSTESRAPRGAVAPDGWVRAARHHSRKPAARRRRASVRSCQVQAPHLSS